MKSKATPFGRRKIIRLFALVMIAASFPPSIGCGPSQQELMMRQAQRSRNDDDPPPAKKAKKVEPPKPEAVAEKKPEEPVKVDEIVTASGQEIVSKEILPISQRKPEQPLSDDDRRLRAYENLKAVSDALLTYMRDKGRLPETYKEASGFQTLSWRVEILPYLGYQDLYDKFDPSVPWNKPPNDALLELIPDEYVSPERFDDRTNIVMPSRRGFIGGEKGNLGADDIEDGLNNTLLIVEVNDKFATAWTSPQDFAPGAPDSARAGALGLRKDGAFGVWANGWPVLLANELSSKVFWDAMSASAGDGLQAGRVHRDIPIKNVSEASVAADDDTPVPTMTPEAVSQSPNDRAMQQFAPIKREDVPTAAKIAASQKKLRKLYADQIKDAKDDQEKSDLAKELLKRAVEIDSESADAHVLQTAAMRFAIEAGDVKHLLAGIDQRVGRFEVDAYEENMNWLLDFGKESATRDPATIQGMEFVKRAIKVNFAAIHDDDYVRAISLTRYAYRMVGQRRSEVIPKNLNTLKSLLGLANREYTDASDSLADFRINPDNGDAAAAVGRYLCFIKGDWKRGLPLCTRGGPEPLREMAALDLKGADDYMNKIAIADAWWELSEKARAGVYKQSARDRAVDWYAQAFAVMPDSLDKLHVKSRLDDAADAPPSSPLAVIDQLANDVSVDLDIGLAAIAAVGQKGNQQPYGRASGEDDYDPDG